jgi:RNA polymerase sigma-70 factor (ECF subfamily)
VDRRSLAALSDTELVAPLKKEDAAAFEELLRRYEPKVYGLARSVTRSESDAQDSLQDTFLSVYRKIESFNEEASLSTWIYRIAINAALMKVRKRRRDERTLPLDDYMPQYDEGGYRTIAGPDWPLRGDEVLLCRELAQILRESILALPHDYRSVFILRDQEGLSTGEVASILELSVPALKSRLHRARLFLRERIKKDWLDSAGVGPRAKSGGS